MASFSAKHLAIPYPRYSMMLACWAMKPGQRPKFSDLVVTVNDLLESYAGYLELSLSPTCEVAATCTTLTPPPSPGNADIPEVTATTTFPLSSSANDAEIELREVAVCECEVEEKENMEA